MSQRDQRRFDPDELLAIRLWSLRKTIDESAEEQEKNGYGFHGVLRRVIDAVPVHLSPIANALTVLPTLKASQAVDVSG
jgi:hypothetical protein